MKQENEQKGEWAEYVDDKLLPMEIPIESDYETGRAPYWVCPNCGEYVHLRGMRLDRQLAMVVSECACGATGIIVGDLLNIIGYKKATVA